MSDSAIINGSILAFHVARASESSSDEEDNEDYKENKLKANRIRAERLLAASGRRLLEHFSIDKSGIMKLNILCKISVVLLIYNSVTKNSFHLLSERDFGSLHLSLHSLYNSFTF